MRIECENCSATYTIDDGQLSDAPIGAQCPYCGHVKLVQKGGSPGANFPMSTMSTGPQGAPAAAPAGAGGYGAPGPTSFGLMGNSGDMLTTPDLGPPPGGAPGFGGGSGNLPAQPATSGGFTIHSPSGNLGTPGATFNPGGGQQLYGSDPDLPRFGGTSLDLSLSDDVGAGRGPSNDLGIPGPVATTASAPNQCQVCGRLLNDEFDKVIGLCDEHQRDRRHGDTDGGCARSAVR